jgi:hypothetical protein
LALALLALALLAWAFLATIDSSSTAPLASALSV